MSSRQHNQSAEPRPPGCSSGELHPKCDDCLVRLAHQAARIAAGEHNQLRQDAESEALEVIKNAGHKDLTSPEIANRIMRSIRTITGADDPYRSIKEEELARAEDTINRLPIPHYLDLNDALSLAALGNSLDFFRPSEEAMPEVERQFAAGITFHRDDRDRLAAFLSRRPNLILYLTDNSGEVFFDVPLYRYMSRFAKRVVLVVKGGPALNDLTRRELELSGLGGVFQEVMDTGTDGAGVDWLRCSPEFVDLFDRADLVLAKGMANFETIVARKTKPPVFFLFKVKCEPVQYYVQAPAESYQAMWRDGSAE